MTTERANCPRCGAPLPEGRLEGLCPRCLLRSGLDGPVVSTPRPFVPIPAEELGDRIPGYEVLELLGRGGMGAVYLARQRKLDRMVAIKVLPPEIGADPTFAERFVREARALARLGHPHIVTIHDFGEADGLFYLVMEYVEGRSLRGLLAGGRPPMETSLEVARQALGALRYAHGKGVVHRDVKPENVLLDDQGHVRITDFGLAKLVEAEGRDESLTGTQQAMGTPHYMAPEQIETPADVDHRADLYSMGVLLYELLTGTLPLGRFPAPSAKGSSPTWLDDVVMRSLEREPEDRYASADEMVDALTGAPPPPPPPPSPPTSERIRRDRRPAARERSKSPNSRKEAADCKALIAIMVAAFVAALSVFLDWFSFSPGAVLGEAFSMPASLPFDVGSARISGARGDIFGLPNWFLVIDAAVLFVLAAGQAFGGWPDLWKGKIAAAVYGLCHVFIAIIQLMDSIFDPAVGIVICVGAFIVCTVLTVRMSPLTPSGKRGLGAVETERHSQKPRRRRRSPTEHTRRKDRG